MPFIDIELYSLMKTHLASNPNNDPNVMVSTPIDMDRADINSTFFGENFECSSDLDCSSIFMKSAPQMSYDSDHGSHLSSYMTDNEEQDEIAYKHHKSVTLASNPMTARTHTEQKEKKKVCRVLFYASKITKRPSIYLKKRKQQLFEAAKPEMQKESLRKLKVFFCHECGTKIYAMSNSNTHLVTEL